MFEMHEACRDYFADYVQKHGHEPAEGILNCAKEIVNTAKRYYSIGECDARKNLPLSDSFIDGLFRNHPGVPADFCDAITDLMKSAYRSGWKDGRGMTG